MEADLSRYYGLDYRDRWRVVDGRRLLTLRMIAVRVRHMPTDSSLGWISRKNEPAWDLQEILLAQIWQAVAHSKRPHPLLERAMRRVDTAARMSPEHLAALARGRQRARARERRLTRMKG